jgi:hypothetical protein
MCHYAECRYAECRYAECCGGPYTGLCQPLLFLVFSTNIDQFEARITLAILQYHLTDHSILATINFFWPL